MITDHSDQNQDITWCHPLVGDFTPTQAKYGLTPVCDQHTHNSDCDIFTKANSNLSSTRNTSHLKRQQALSSHTHTHTHTQHVHAKLWQCVYMQFMQHRKNNPIKGILLVYGMKL